MFTPLSQQNRILYEDSYNINFIIKDIIAKILKVLNVCKEKERIDKINEKKKQMKEQIELERRSIIFN